MLNKLRRGVFTIWANL